MHVRSDIRQAELHSLVLEGRKSNSSHCKVSPRSLRATQPDRLAAYVSASARLNRPPSACRRTSFWPDALLVQPRSSIVSAARLWTSTTVLYTASIAAQPSHGRTLRLLLYQPTLASATPDFSAWCEVQLAARVRVGACRALLPSKQGGPLRRIPCGVQHR